MDLLFLSATSLAKMRGISLLFSIGLPSLIILSKIMLLGLLPLRNPVEDTSVSKLVRLPTGDRLGALWEPIIAGARLRSLRGGSLEFESS